MKTFIYLFPRLKGLKNHPRDPVDLPGDAGGSCNLIIKGAIVNRVATTLVELHHIQTLAAVVLKRSDALVLLQHST